VPWTMWGVTGTSKRSCQYSEGLNAGLGEEQGAGWERPRGGQVIFGLDSGSLER
jgi:hypothetical protein